MNSKKKKHRRLDISQHKDYDYWNISMGFVYKGKKKVFSPRADSNAAICYGEADVRMPFWPWQNIKKHIKFHLGWQRSVHMTIITSLHHLNDT